MNVIGDVQGRTCLIIDDIIDTAGTLVKTAQALLDAGAVKVYAAASHAVLSGQAIERISSSRLEEVIVTDSIPLREEAQRLERLGKIKVLSVAGLLGATMEGLSYGDQRQFVVQLGRAARNRVRRFVMAEQEVVAAKTREGKFDKNAARRVRVAGMIPGVLYGAKEPSIAVELDPKQITRILHSESGHNTIFDLEIGTGKTKAMIVDWQYEPWGIQALSTSSHPTMWVFWPSTGWRNRVA